MASLAEEEVFFGNSIPYKHRIDLRHRLEDNFCALVFHKLGGLVHPDHDVAGIVAADVESTAYSAACAELSQSKHEAAARSVYIKVASGLLLAEVMKYLQAMHSNAVSSSLAAVSSEALDLDEFAGCLKPVQTQPSLAHKQITDKNQVWGWLVPGSRQLPYVLLKGNGVAIGRGREALWASSSATSTQQPSPRAFLAAGSERKFQEVLKRNMGFVEVADGRVSRLHCTLSLHWPLEEAAPVVLLEDCSSNGTFLNTRQLARGEMAPLADGDRISLVLSVAPLAEQFFTFRRGDPREAEYQEGEEWALEASSDVYSPASVVKAIRRSTSTALEPLSHPAIYRTATSRYTTAEQSTLEDLTCQICLCTLAKCVAIDPCGHNFCAACLSHHFGSQLQGGLQISCPFRCPPPERIVVNYAVRALVELLEHSSQLQQRGSAAAQLAGPKPPAFADAGTSPPQRQGSGSEVALPRQRGRTSTEEAPGSRRAAPAAVEALRQQHRRASSPASPSRLRHVSVDGEGLRRSEGGVHPSQGGRPGAGAHSRGSSSVGDAQLGPSTAAPLLATASATVSGAEVASASPAVAAAGGGRSSSPTPRETADSLDDDFYSSTMSVLCPLNDEYLPMDASNLKSKQVEVALAQLKDMSRDDSVHQTSLEALARLAWSDDDVRQAVADSNGVKYITQVMQLHGSNDGIQCNGCLALMSLVRGEGDVCQTNQWAIAKAGSVEVMAAAMRSFRGSAMVQLSALLAMIPLALENAMMQAHLTQECLPDVLAALDNHPQEPDIQTKGLVLLGVLIQGDDVVHDSIRQRQLEEGVPRRVAAALKTFTWTNDDILWAALFVLAVMLRDTSTIHLMAAEHIARAGMLDLLHTVVEGYKERCAEVALEPDEMILTAGDFLTRTLQPVAAKMRFERRLVLGGAAAAAAGVGLALAFKCWHRLR